MSAVLTEEHESSSKGSWATSPQRPSRAEARKAEGRRASTGSSAALTLSSNTKSKYHSKQPPHVQVGLRTGVVITYIWCPNCTYAVFFCMILRFQNGMSLVSGWNAHSAYQTLTQHCDNYTVDCLITAELVCILCYNVLSHHSAQESLVFVIVSHWYDSHAFFTRLSIAICIKLRLCRTITLASC